VLRPWTLDPTVSGPVLVAWQHIRGLSKGRARKRSCAAWGGMKASMTSKLPAKQLLAPVPKRARTIISIQSVSGVKSSPQPPAKGGNGSGEGNFTHAQLARRDTCFTRANVSLSENVLLE
jgi:hypothetical protein